VIRPYSHSLSDNEKLYRPEAERQKDALRDPVTRMQLFLVRENILGEDELGKLEKSVDADVQAAVDRALTAAFPATDSIYTTFILKTLIRAAWSQRRSRTAGTRLWLN